VRVYGGRCVCEEVAVTVTKTLAVMAASVVAPVMLVDVADVGVKLGEVGTCRSSTPARCLTTAAVVDATELEAVMTGVVATIGA